MHWISPVLTKGRQNKEVHVSADMIDPVLSSDAMDVETATPTGVGTIPPSNYPKQDGLLGSGSNSALSNVLFEDYFPSLDLTEEEEDSLIEWFDRDLKSCVKNVNNERSRWATYRAVYMLEYIEKFYPDMGMGADYSSGLLCEKMLEGMDRLRRSVFGAAPLFVPDTKQSGSDMDPDFMHRAQWALHTVLIKQMRLKKKMGYETLFEYLLDGSAILEADTLFEKIPQRTLKTYTAVEDLMADEDRVLDQSRLDKALNDIQTNGSARVLVEEDVVTENGLQIFHVSKIDHLVPEGVYSDEDIKFRGRRMYLTAGDLRLLASDEVKWYKKDKVDKVVADRELKRTLSSMSKMAGDSGKNAMEQLNQMLDDSSLIYPYYEEGDKLTTAPTSQPYKDVYSVYRVTCKYGYRTKSDPDGVIPKYCLAKGTMIHTAVGELPIESLVGTTPVVFGYSNKKKRVVATRASKVAKTGTKEVVEVNYEWWSPSGGTKTGKIEVTPDHKLLLRSGKYVEAQDLAVGDSLMPFTHTEVLGYRQVWLNDPLRTKCPEHLLVHTDMKGEVPWDYQVHHIDRNKQNCDPDNLVALSEDDHHAAHGFERGTRFKKMWAQMTPEQRSLVLSERNIQAWRKGRRNPLKEMWEKLTPEQRTEKGKENYRLRLQHAKEGNHTVTSVVWAGKVVDVYDMEVPETHNFAAAGIIVHNCVFDYSPEGRVILRAVTYPHFNERKNYFHMKYGYAPNSYYGFGYGARLLQDDYMLSNAVDLYLESAALSTFNPMLCKHPDVGGMYPWYDGYGPGKVGYVNDMNDFEQVEQKPPNMSLLRVLLPLIQERSANRTSVTSLVQGQAESSDPRSPASKTAMLLQEGSVGLEMMIEDWNETGWEEMAAFIWMGMKEVATYVIGSGEDVSSAFGGLVVKTPEETANAENKITVDELSRDIVWKSLATAGLMNPEIKMERFLKLFQFFVPMLEKLAQFSPDVFKIYFLRWMRAAAQEVDLPGISTLIPTQKEIEGLPADQLMGTLQNLMENMRAGRAPGSIEMGKQ
jgi:hypothetical protein